MQDERYAEVTGLNIIAPQQTNGVHQTDYELQRLSESAEASYIFDNPVYADSGPITFSQDELYESVSVFNSIPKILLVHIKEQRYDDNCI